MLKVVRDMSPINWQACDNDATYSTIQATISNENVTISKMDLCRTEKSVRLRFKRKTKSSSSNNNSEWPQMGLMGFVLLATLSCLADALQTPATNFIGSSTRLCVTQDDYAQCLLMSSVSGGTLTCVKARDRYECMKNIIDDRADIVNLNNEELYLAGRLYNLEPFAMEQFNNDTRHYQAVVIVDQRAQINKIADLKGKRSCHGSFKSTAGWDIPIGLLLATMTLTPDCRGELYSVGKFFESSCAPDSVFIRTPINHLQTTNTPQRINLEQFFPLDCNEQTNVYCVGPTTTTTTTKLERIAHAQIYEHGIGLNPIGSWSSDAYIDSELKRLHPNLCAACNNSTLCSASDEFAGDFGALKCLFSGYGQVAFTTSKLVEDFLSSSRFDRRIIENYAYLCLDGTKLPLTSRACEWAHKPTNVYVTDPSRQLKKLVYLSHLQTLFDRYVPYRPSWWQMRSLFSHPTNVTQILPVPQELQQWDKYLGNFISSIEKPLPHCESNNITICASSKAEESKCLDLQKAAFSLRIRPEIDCKMRANKFECLSLIAKHQADLTTIDLSSLHEVPSALIQSLEPIGVTQQAFVDYAVAVVRADSGIRFLYDLAGRRSCHGAYGDLAAWWAPQTVLSERSLLDPTSCNKAEQMADYFAGSCVPGAADLRVNQYKSGSDRLCALCKGDQFEQHQCERSPSERYFGHGGALRCLVEGTGEVAFMSMTTLASNVDGRSQENWARKIPLALDSRNFRLICRSGPSMLLGDYERCHLTRLPGKIIVSNRFNSREDRLMKRLFLTQLEEKFIRDSGQNNMFELFGSYQNETDLLFDDFTNRIIPQRLDMSTFEMITKQHFDPSYQLLPFIGGKSGQQSCKLILATGKASSLRPQKRLQAFNNLEIINWVADISSLLIPTILVTFIINSITT